MLMIRSVVLNSCRSHRADRRSPQKAVPQPTTCAQLLSESQSGSRVARVVGKSVHEGCSTPVGVTERIAPSSETCTHLGLNDSFSCIPCSIAFARIGS